MENKNKELLDAISPYIDNCVFILAQSYIELMKKGIPKDVVVEFSPQILRLILDTAKSEKKEPTPNISTLMAILSAGGKGQ